MEYTFNCPVCSNIQSLIEEPAIYEKLREEIVIHGIQNEITGILLKFLFTPNFDPEDSSPEAKRGIALLKKIIVGHIPTDRKDSRVIDPVEVLFLLVTRLLLNIHIQEGQEHCYKNRFRCQTALIVLDTTNNKALKAELQDYFFAFVSPSTYQYLLDRLPTPKVKMIKVQQFIQAKLLSIFKKSKINASIETRMKSLYSTFRKTQRKGILPSEVDDLLGFRIITHSLEECYRALEVIQRKWGARDQVVQDYIQESKKSGYQSIHLHLLVQNVPVEFQIRDKAMHHIAERGSAAHGEYKLSSSYAG